MKNLLFFMVLVVPRAWGQDRVAAYAKHFNQVFAGSGVESLGASCVIDYIEGSKSEEDVIGAVYKESDESLKTVYKERLKAVVAFSKFLKKTLNGKSKKVTPSMLAYKLSEEDLRVTRYLSEDNGPFIEAAMRLAIIDGIIQQ